MKTAIVTLCAVFIGVLACFAESTPDQQNTALSKKLDSIVIPHVEFTNANLNTIVRYLNDVGKENDPDKTGVNIVLMDKENKSKITLPLIKKVSLHKVLKLVTEMAGLSLDIKAGIVILRKPKEKK
jgi:hypothetical protein